MVSKCANPECTTPFRYFHEGRLFRLDIENGYEQRRELGDGIAKKPLRHLEFYWLCESCSKKMTLAIEKGEGVRVRPTAMVRGAA